MGNGVGGYDNSFGCFGGFLCSGLGFDDSDGGKMIEKLNSVQIGIGEFLWKFFVVLVFIMPICVGGCFWIGVQLDAVANIHLLKFIMPFVGSFIGFILASLLVMMGHNEQENSEKEIIQQYSDRLVSRFDMMETPKLSLPSRRKIY